LPWKRFEVESEEIRESGAGLQDGFWEVSSLIREREKEIGLLRDAGVKDAEVVAIEAMFDALKQGVEVLGDGEREERFQTGLERVRSMDVSVAKFKIPE